MPRHFWISASIAILVAAFALFAFALPQLYMLDGATSSVRDPSSQQLVTYQVPPGRAEAIQSSMNSVLQVNKEGVQPLGYASLPTPDQLLIAAPERMQGSIRRAIAILSQGEAAGTRQDAQASVDVWLVEALAADVPADPRLAEADQVLAVARQRFSHRQYRLKERLMIVADLRGTPARSAGSLFRQAELRLAGQGAGAIDGHVQVVIADSRVIGTFESKLVLPEGQWQVVGLLSGSATTPEHLLLMRQTPVQSNPGP